MTGAVPRDFGDDGGDSGVGRARLVTDCVHAAVRGPAARVRRVSETAFDCDVDGPEVMDENCTMRPCATDFSIAAIMSRHGRARNRCREPPDAMSPLGKWEVGLAAHGGAGSRRLRRRISFSIQYLQHDILAM